MKFMVNAFKKYLLKIWFDSAKQNHVILASYIDPARTAKVLDIGCDTGELIIERLRKISNPEIYGIDIRPEAVSSSKKLGIKAVESDVEKGLPFKSGFFDIVFANQIIEHLYDVDFFVKEVRRVLKPKGYLILSTENLSSWHNIFALLLGWQAFSQTVSLKKNVGNPLRLIKTVAHSSGAHVKIFTPRGLRELFKLYGFKIEKFLGAGYYPFPPFLSKIGSWLDPTHCAFITLKARKVSQKNE